MFFSFCIPVCISLSRTSLRGVWWGRHRSTDQGVGERLSPACSHTWTSGWHDGKRQNRPGLLQVSITQEFISVLSYFYWFKTSTVALQLPGPGWGRPHVGHGFWTTDQTHRGARYNATQRHPTDYDVQCHFPKGDPGKCIFNKPFHIAYCGKPWLYTKIVMNIDSRSRLSGGLHFPGGGSCWFHVRKYYTEGCLGGGSW